MNGGELEVLLYFKGMKKPAAGLSFALFAREQLFGASKGFFYGPLFFRKVYTQSLLLFQHLQPIHHSEDFVLAENADVTTSLQISKSDWWEEKVLYTALLSFHAENWEKQWVCLSLLLLLTEKYVFFAAKET